MISTFDYLGLRRMPINYFSPAVCEADFSSTSEPSVVLDPFVPLQGPTGLTWEQEGGNVRLRWTSFPGALCYSVYRAVDALDPFGEYVLVQECTEDTDIILPAGTYRITAITNDGETDASGYIVAGAESGQCNPPLVFFESTDGATVLEDASAKFISYSSPALLTELGYAMQAFYYGTFYWDKVNGLEYYFEIGWTPDVPYDRVMWSGVRAVGDDNFTNLQMTPTILGSYYSFVFPDDDLNVYNILHLDAPGCSWGDFGPQPLCPQDGVPVPDDFLDPSEEVIETIVTDPVNGFSSVKNITTPGRFELNWDSGHMTEDCGIFLGKAIPSCYFRDGSDVLIQFWDPTAMDMPTATENYGCQWLFFQPPPCDPPTDIAAARPDGILAQLDLDPDTVGAGFTLKIFGNPMGGGCGITGGSSSFTFKRTHVFKPQPAVITIQSYPSEGDIVLVGPTGYNAASCVYTALLGLGQVQVNGMAGNAWQLNIGPEWAGVKTYGETAVGFYTRTSPPGPGVPDCLVII